MSFNIDYDERTEFPPIEPGIHNATIHSAEPEAGPKATYLKLRFNLLDNPLNQQAWFNLSLANGSLWRVSNLVRELDLSKGKVEYKSRKEFETLLQEMLTGVPVRIRIETEEFEGTLQDRVVKIMAPAAK